MAIEKTIEQKMEMFYGQREARKKNLLSITENVKKI